MVRLEWSGSPGGDGLRVVELHLGRDVAIAKAGCAEPRRASGFREPVNLPRVGERGCQRLIDEHRFVRGKHRLHLLQVNAPVDALQQNSIDVLA